jgi:hypothetical protein
MTEWVSWPETSILDGVRLKGDSCGGNLVVSRASVIELLKRTSLAKLHKRTVFFDALNVRSYWFPRAVIKERTGIISEVSKFEDHHGDWCMRSSPRRAEIHVAGP